MRIFRQGFAVLGASLTLLASSVIGAPVASAVATTWAAPDALSGSTVDSYAPHVVLSEDGAHAISVFAEDDVIRASSQGSVGTDAKDLSDSDPVLVSSDPQIGASSDGGAATVVWAQSRVPTRIIFANSGTVAIDDGTNDATMTWGTAEPISTGEELAFAPQIAVSSDGDTAVAVWTEYLSGTGTYAVYAAVGVDLTTVIEWSDPLALSDASQTAGGPAVAISPDGDQATVVWSRSNGQKTVIQAATIDDVSGEPVVKPVQDLTSGTQNARNAQVAMAYAGSRNVAVAVWTRFNRSVEVVQSANALIDSVSGIANWGDPLTLSPSTLAVDKKPQVALSDDGSRAMAVWVLIDGTSTRVIQARLGYDLDTVTPAWDPTTTTLSSNASDAKAPQVDLGSVIGGDQATVVWSHQDPSSTYGVIESRSAFVDTFALTPTAIWNSMTLVSDVDLLTDGAFPDVAVSGDGAKAAVVWEQNDDGSPAYKLVWGSLGTVDFDGPVNTGLPSISGKLQAGSTLKASTGRWTGATRYEFQWQRCSTTSSGSCTVDIWGATASSYLLSGDDAGKYIRVKVTAYGVGSDVAYSNVTRIIKAAR